MLRERLLWPLLLAPLLGCRTTKPEPVAPVAPGAPIESAPATTPRPTEATPDVRAWRERMVAIAEDYAEHEWTPSEVNLAHAEDEQGVWVDTPRKRTLPCSRT